MLLLSMHYATRMVVVLMDKCSRSLVIHCCKVYVWCFWCLDWMFLMVVGASQLAFCVVLERTSNFMCRMVRMKMSSRYRLSDDDCVCFRGNNGLSKSNFPWSRLCGFTFFVLFWLSLLPTYFSFCYRW